MASKYLLESSAIYIDGTDIPHSKLGITNAEELHEFYKAHPIELTRKILNTP